MFRTLIQWAWLAHTGIKGGILGTVVEIHYKKIFVNFSPAWPCTFYSSPLILRLFFFTRCLSLHTFPRYFLLSLPFGLFSSFRRVLPDAYSAGLNTVSASWRRHGYEVPGAASWPRLTHYYELHNFQPSGRPGYPPVVGSNLEKCMVATSPLQGGRDIRSEE